MSQFDDWGGAPSKTSLKESLINLANSNMTDEQIKQLLRSLIDDEKKIVVSTNSQWGDR